jgi:hypothetical protein
MKLDEFMVIFPSCPFALHYVERGEHKSRSFGWHASFTTSYWTSDTDRPIYVQHPPRFHDGKFIEGWGATPEEALEQLARGVLNNAQSAERHARKRLAECESAHARLAEQFETSVCLEAAMPTENDDK